MLTNDHSTKSCFLCGNPPSYAKFNILTKSYEFDCPVCGRYILTEWAKAALDADSTSEQRQALAWIVRDRPNYLETIKQEDVPELVRSALLREPTPSGKVRLLFRELKNRSRAFGRGVKFDVNREWPRLKARGPDECQALVDVMRESGFLARPAHLEDTDLVLTWKAWETLDPVHGSAAGTVFVAMAFRPDVDAIYDQAIRPAIERCGLTAIRIDRQTFSDKICEQILSEIHAAEFVMADFTHHRAGVYFEAGYAMALGKPVIWSCREDHFTDVHFDTRQYPHIIWRTETDLAGEIEGRLKAMIARSLGRDTA
jgi:hypothetical protein